MHLTEQLTVTDISDVITVYSERGRYLQMVERKNYGLSFCKSGEIVYFHKGRQIVSSTDCAVLLPMGENYELRGTKTGEFPLINFLCSEEIHDFYVFPIHHLEPYLRDFEKMKEQALLRRGRQKQMSLLYGILDRLAGEDAEKGDVLAPVLRYLEKNYADPQLSNEVLARSGEISEVYLRQLFRTRFGTSPRQYVLELRMQKAKRLLEEGGADVGEIAVACGFSAIYHFCRTFKALVGETPTQYRRRNQNILL